MPTRAPSEHPTVQPSAAPSISATVGPTLETTRAPTLHTTTANVTAVLVGECSIGYFGLQNDSCTPCIEGIRANLLHSAYNARISTRTGGDNDINSKDALHEANSRGYFPQGFTCPVAGAMLPLASPGWYVQYERVPSLRCSANSQKQTAVCPAAWPCDPPEACLGGNTCSSLYTGERCAECASGMLRINQHCVSCDAAYYGLLLLAVFAVVYGVYIVWNRMGAEILLRCYIGLDIVQLLSLLSTVALTSATPFFVSTALNTLTLLNLNPALLTSSCLGVPYFATLDAETKFLYIFCAVNLLPVVVAVLLYPVCMCGVLFRKICVFFAGYTTTERVLYDAPVEPAFTLNNKDAKSPANRKNSSDERDRANQLHQQCVLPSSLPTTLVHDNVVYSNAVYTYWISLAVVLALLYCLLLTTSLSVFDCTATTPDDNYSYLTALGPTVQGRCGVADGVQESLVPYAIVSSVVYGLGIPLYLYVLYKYLQKNTATASTSNLSAVVGTDGTMWSPRQLMLSYFRRIEENNSKGQSNSEEAAEGSFVSAATLRAVRWVLCTVVRKSSVLIVLYFTHSTGSSGKVLSTAGLAGVIAVLIVSYFCVGRNTLFTRSTEEPKPLIIDVHDNASETSTVLSATRAYCMSKVKEKMLVVLCACVTVLVIVLSLVHDKTVCLCMAVLLVALLCVIVIYALCVATSTVSAHNEEQDGDELTTPYKHESARYRDLLGMYGDCEVGEGCSVQDKNNALHSLFSYSNSASPARTPPRTPSRPLSTASTPYNRTSKKITSTSASGTPLAHADGPVDSTAAEETRKSVDPVGMDAFMKQASPNARLLSGIRPPPPPLPQLPPYISQHSGEGEADSESSPSRLSVRAGVGSYKRARNAKGASTADQRHPVQLPAYMQGASGSLFADTSDDAMYGSSSTNNRSESKSIDHDKGVGIMSRLRRLSLHKDTKSSQHSDDKKRDSGDWSDWELESDGSDADDSGRNGNKDCAYRRRYSISPDHARFSVENPLKRNSEVNHPESGVAVPAVGPSEAPFSSNAGWSDMWPFRWSSSDHPTPHTPTRVASTGRSLPSTPGSLSSPSARGARHSIGHSATASVPISPHSNQQPEQQQQRLKAHITRYSAPPAFLTSPERRRRSLTSLFSNKQAIAEANSVHGQEGIQEQQGIKFRSIRHSAPMPPPPPPPPRPPFSLMSKNMPAGQSKHTKLVTQMKQLSAHNLQSLRSLHTFYPPSNPSVHDGLSDEARAFADYNDFVYGPGSARHTTGGMVDRNGYNRSQRHKATTRMSKRYKFLRNTHYRKSFNLPAPISYVEYVKVPIDSPPGGDHPIVHDVAVSNNNSSVSPNVHPVVAPSVPRSEASANYAVSAIRRNATEARKRSDSNTTGTSHHSKNVHTNNVNTITSSSAAGNGAKSPAPKRVDRSDML